MNNFEFRIEPRFGMKIYHDGPYKVTKRYMFHRKKRIQKKWDKRYIEIKTITPPTIPMVRTVAV